MLQATLRPPDTADLMVIVRVYALFSRVAQAYLDATKNVLKRAEAARRLDTFPNAFNR